MHIRWVIRVRMNDPGDHSPVTEIGFFVFDINNVDITYLFYRSLIFFWFLLHWDKISVLYPPQYNVNISLVLILIDNSKKTYMVSYRNQNAFIT